MLSTGSFNKSTGNDPISLTTNPDETSSTSSSAPTLSAEPHGTAVNHYLNYLKSSHRTAAPTPANALSPSPGQDAVNAQDSHSNPYHGPYGQHRFDRDYGRENNAPMADEAEARRIWAEKGWLPAIAGVSRFIGFLNERINATGSIGIMTTGSTSHQQKLTLILHSGSHGKKRGARCCTGFT